LGELASEPFAQLAAARLEEARLTAVEGRVEAGLALGQHAALVGELEALVAEHPLREALRAKLMLAMYRRAARRTPWPPTSSSASSTESSDWNRLPSCTAWRRRSSSRNPNSTGCRRPRSRSPRARPAAIGTQAATYLAGADGPVMAFGNTALVSADQLQQAAATGG
jgi:DNA-binding SARP family transcriptional activator